MSRNRSSACSRMPSDRRRETPNCSDMMTDLLTSSVARWSVRSSRSSLRDSSWRAQANPLTDAPMSASSTAMMALRMRALRRRARSARRTISSRLTARSPATILTTANGLPSPLLRASAAIGSSGSWLNSPPAPIRKRSAGGKHSCTGCPGSPSTITAITRAAPPIALKRRISSLTYLLCAARGEQITTRNCEAASAASVCSVSE